MKSVPLQTPGLPVRSDGLSTKSTAKGEDAFGALLEKTTSKSMPGSRCSTTDMQTGQSVENESLGKNMKPLIDITKTGKESLAEEGDAAEKENMQLIDVPKLNISGNSKVSATEVQALFHNANIPGNMHLPSAGQQRGTDSSHSVKVQLNSEIQAEGKSTFADMKSSLKMSGPRAFVFAQSQERTITPTQERDDDRGFSGDLIPQPSDLAGAKSIAWNQSPVGFQKDIANSISAALGAPQVHEVAPTVVNLMRDNATGDIKILRLRLHPAELGQLSIKMQRQGDELNISVQAQTVLAHDRIMAEKDEILRTLEVMGITVSTITIQPLPEHGLDGLSQDGGSGSAFSDGAVIGIDLVGRLPNTKVSCKPIKARMVIFRLVPNLQVFISSSRHWRLNPAQSAFDWSFCVPWIARRGKKNAKFFRENTN